MRVGIIGGGASGLITAWLLDQTHTVTLYEKSGRLGGHAQTVPITLQGQTIPIDIGFEFFTPNLFPHFFKLLSHLAVPIQSFPLTYTFHTLDNKTTLVFPPLSNSAALLKIIYPRNLIIMLQLNYFMKSGTSIITRKKTNYTIEQFINSLFLSESFKNTILYPILASGWGDTINNFKLFAAYDILRWLYEAPAGLWPGNWFEIIDGTSAYINVLTQKLLKTKIKLTTSIQHIIYQDSCYKIIESDGTSTDYDHLIIATNPQDASTLLKSIPHASSTRSILNKINFFPATLALHSDHSFMPKNKADWSVANIRSDGNNSALTIYKPWKSCSLPIFRSWILPKDSSNVLEKNRLPDHLYALEHFQHQQVTPTYFEAQNELNTVQGNHNIWFVGSYTHDIDSHESALVSALHVAQQLAPHSERLKTII